MDLLQLKYFQTVARLENITKAAQELHIAQPSLSKTISRLEKDLGVPLFERYGKRIRLNQFGKVYLERVNKSFKELDDGKRELDDMSGAKKGSITVGSTTSRLLPNLFSEYLKEHSSIKFRLHQVLIQSEIEQLLLDGRIDLCITTLPIKMTNVICRPLINESIYLATPLYHRLSDKASINIGDIENDPLIYYTAECGLREIMDQYCLQADFNPNIAFECTTLEVIYGLVKAGFGCAFLPSYMWNIINNKSISKVSITAPSCHRTIWLSWTKDHYVSNAVNDFKEFIINYFNKTQ